MNIRSLKNGLKSSLYANTKGTETDTARNDKEPAEFLNYGIHLLTKHLLPWLLPPSLHCWIVITGGSYLKAIKGLIS